MRVPPAESPPTTILDGSFVRESVFIPGESLVQLDWIGRVGNESVFEGENCWVLKFGGAFEKRQESEEEFQIEIR
jgi:hypothetical protein